MLLTGTSVAALARGIGRGARAPSSTLVFLKQGEDPALGDTHAEWRRHREVDGSRPAPTDVMSDYPENDEDFEPTVAVADDSPFAEGVFDFAAEAAETRDRRRGLARHPRTRSGGRCAARRSAPIRRFPEPVRRSRP